MELGQTFEKYQELIAGISKGNDPANLDVYQDGKVIRMLLEQNHSPENIRQAVIDFSPVANRQATEKQPQTFPPGYATNLINQAQNVIQAINDIKEFNAPKDVKLDAFSEYKNMAKWHLAQKDASLNSHMDADIAFRMLQRGHSPLNIEKALLEMSPVAREAGRSTENYSKYVVETAVQNREKYLEKQKAAQENYPYTVQEYANKKASLEKIQGFISSPAYQEGRIVRELLEQGHDKNNLIKAITENTVVKEGKNPENYAKYIVNGVINEMNAEKTIRDFDDTFLNFNSPLTLSEKYLNRAKKILDRNPDERFNASIDTFVAKTLINDRSDVEKIKETIAELSPISKQPGMTPDYPAQVIEKAYEKLALEQENMRKINANYPAVAEAYIHQAEQWKNANPEREYSNYSDGKIAMQLLRNGHEPENVQKILSEMSIVAYNLNQEKGTDTERYAKAVVYQTMQSMERYENAKSVEPKENPEIKAPTAAVEYQHHLKEYIDRGANINANVDIAISKTMLGQGYSNDEVYKAINDVSPVIIEAGRNPENYVKYIQSSVEQQQSQSLSQNADLNGADLAARTVTVEDISVKIYEKIKETTNEIFNQKKAGNDVKEMALANQEMKSLRTMLDKINDRTQPINIKGAATVENLMAQKKDIGKQISSIRSKENENNQGLGKER